LAFWAKTISETSGKAGHYTGAPAFAYNEAYYDHIRARSGIDYGAPGVIQFGKIA